MSLVASRADLDFMRSVDDARMWIGLSQEVWAALDATLGNVPSLRVLALLPQGILAQSISGTVIQQAETGRVRGLNLIEAHQARIMRSLARQKFNLPEEDPLESLEDDIVAKEEEEQNAPRPAALVPPARPAEPQRPAEEATARPEPAGPAPEPPWARAPPQTSPGVIPIPPSMISSRSGPSNGYPEAMVRPLLKEDEGWNPRENPQLDHVQVMKTQNFYSILRTRGLHLGPRFRAVKMAAGLPGSCYALLHPRRPPHRAQRLPGGPTQERWWKDYLPGNAPPTAPPPREDEPKQVGTGRKAKANLWPGGKVPKDGKGQGLLPELEDHSLQGPGLIITRELLNAGGLVLPARAGHVPGTVHPAVLDQEDDDSDEPWTFLPGLYDAILTCTFVAANPVPGATTSQLPIPFRIQDFKLSPHVRSSEPYFGHIHPLDETKGSHYCEIYNEQGRDIMDVDGFYPRIQSRPAGDSKSVAQTATAASVRSGFQGYIYRTASPGPGRSPSPAVARGGAASGSAAPRSGSRGAAGRSATPGGRRGRRNASQETGSASLTQAERDEVRERVAKWSKYVQ